MNRRTGISMVELSIALLVGSIIVLAGSRLLVSGLNSFRKSTHHLNISQAIGIVLAQLENDLKRTTQILGCTPVSLQIRLQDLDPAGKVSEYTVTWERDGSGIGLLRRMGTGTPQKLCQGYRISDLQFSLKPDSTAPKGVMTQIAVSEPKRGRETFAIKRFFFGDSLPANALIKNFQD